MAILTELPNIGPELSKLLIQADILNEFQLKETGAEQTFLRLRAIDPTACINKLYAIEGAIQGIRWHHLESSRKNELLHFFRLINKSTTY